MRITESSSFSSYFTPYDSQASILPNEQAQTKLMKKLEIQRSGMKRNFKRVLTNEVCERDPELIAHFDLVNSFKKQARDIQNKNTLDYLQQEAQRFNINPNTILTKVQQKMENQWESSRFKNESIEQTNNSRRNYQLKIDSCYSIQPINSHIQIVKSNANNIHHDIENVINKVNSKLIGTACEKRIAQAVQRDNHNTKQRIEQDNTKYHLNVNLAMILGTDTRITKQQLIDNFIQFAVNNELVDLKTHEYQIFKHTKLRAVFNLDILAPKQLAMHLFRFLSKKPLQQQKLPNAFDLNLDEEIERYKIKRKIEKEARALDCKNRRYLSRFKDKNNGINMMGQQDEFEFCKESMQEEFLNSYFEDSSDYDNLRRW